MKYVAFFVAKIALVAGFMCLLWKGLLAVMPEPDRVLTVKLAPFATDLGYTAAVMVFWLIGVALVYLAVLDQRYRCRTCLVRLRMPLTTGGWNHIIFGSPRTEYICPYGHGTLRVSDLHLESPELTNWRPIDDMWKELHDLEETHK